MAARQPLPIGIDDFRRVVEEDYYYVDKSLLIKDLLDTGSSCTLLPRPRRFGKTLNLSMLRYFFEQSDWDTSVLFRDLAIWRQGPPYTDKQGQYPVIHLTFKDVKCATWDECLIQLQEALSQLYLQHRSLLADDRLDPYEARVYRGIIEHSATKSAYEFSLQRLSSYLHQRHGKRTVILIDEYDAPIQAGFQNGYYQEVVGFMRNLLGAALKGNESLEKGVLTGILRVAKESVFSGLNNLDVCTLLNRRYSEHFGLLEHEVDDLLRHYGITQESATVRGWYNGYRFGERVVYNPWSVLQFVNHQPEPPRAYWVNTSDNALVRQLLTRQAVGIQEDMEHLIRRESILKPIDEHVVFSDLDGNPEALWSFLLFSGYLKAVSQEQHNSRLFCRLEIPNDEVAVVYDGVIRSWLENSSSHTTQKMLAALVAGEVESFAPLFQQVVLNTFSYLDVGGDQPEVVYHAFVLGLLVALRDTHEVKSNRESGFGRADILLIPKDVRQSGVIFEFKKAGAASEEALERSAQEALRQIAAKEYGAELRERGVSKRIELGIAFCGKSVWVAAHDDDAPQ